MKRQVKIIEYREPADLEREINMFLASDSVELIDIKYSTIVDEVHPQPYNWTIHIRLHCAMIIYEKKDRILWD